MTGFDSKRAAAVDKLQEREALKLALEALETLVRYENPETKIQVRKSKGGGPILTMYPHKVASDAAQSLRQAIAELESQEPMALVIDGVLVKSALPEKYTGHLYTTPPQRPWVGLTDEEIESALPGYRAIDALDIYHAIEAKLKEKNT